MGAGIWAQRIPLVLAISKLWCHEVKAHPFIIVGSWALMVIWISVIETGFWWCISHLALQRAWRTRRWEAVRIGWTSAKLRLRVPEAPPVTTKCQFRGGGFTLEFFQVPFKVDQAVLARVQSKKM